ncbi:MAG TPA: hypothetical protein VMA83_02540 [Solirubrobacteraceae bacterium]|nr:hypothetical protein [Solirubrobacteraceae bacterium]
MRAGESTALVGVALIVASLLTPSYTSAGGDLSAWETFGASVTLQLAAACAALAMIVAALTERESPAHSVATAVWCVPLALLATIASVIRALELPGHATAPAVGVWLALAGSCAILIGSWIVVRDEHTPLYTPAKPNPRPRP